MVMTSIDWNFKHFLRMMNPEILQVSTKFCFQVEAFASRRTTNVLQSKSLCFLPVTGCLQAASASLVLIKSRMPSVRDNLFKDERKVVPWRIL